MLIPKITTLTIPISLFLTVLASLNRIRTESELLILWASGESNASILLKPILLVSFSIFLIYLIITIAITPYSLNEIRQKIIEIRSSGINSSILQERKFISPTDTLTIFIGASISSDVKGLRRFFCTVYRISSNAKVTSLLKSVTVMNPLRLSTKGLPMMSVAA